VVRRAPNLREDSQPEFNLQIPGIVPPPPPPPTNGRPAPMEVEASRAESGAPPTQEPAGGNQNQSISLEDADELERPGVGPSVGGPAP
jgi:hypothetical protein